MRVVSADPRILPGKFSARRPLCRSALDVSETLMGSSGWRSHGWQRLALGPVRSGSDNPEVIGVLLPAYGGWPEENDVEE